MIIKTICGVLFLIAFAVVLLFLTWKHNVVELEYATYQEAVDAGAFTHAALPDFLPRSSTKIRSSRNLDLNDSELTFDFGDDFKQFIGQQKSGDVLAATALAKRHGEHFSDLNGLTYFPLLSSEPGVYHGSLLLNLAAGKAVYVEPPEGSDRGEASLR